MTNTAVESEMMEQVNLILPRVREVEFDPELGRKLSCDARAKRMIDAINSGLVANAMNLVSDLSHHSRTRVFETNLPDHDKHAKTRKKAINKYVGRVLHNVKRGQIGIAMDVGHSKSSPGKKNPDKPLEFYPNLQVIRLFEDGQICNTTWSVNEVVLLSQSTMEFLMTRYNLKM